MEKELVEHKALEVLLERARKIAYPPYPGYSLYIDLNWVEDLIEDTWQAALSEGRRLGLEEAAQALIDNECSMTGVRAVRVLIVGGGEVRNG